MDVRAAINFANWLSLEHPKLYQQAADRADLALELRNQRAGNRGLGIIDIEPAPTEKTGWLDTFLKTAAGLGTTYLDLKNQRDQLKINLERAQIGLDPINVDGTPSFTTEVVLPQGTIDKITASAGFQINKILLWGGVAAAAFFLLR